MATKKGGKTGKKSRGAPSKISRVRTEFDAACADALALHDLGRQLDQPRLSDELVKLGLSRAKGYLIIAQGFLRLMGAWEQFVEGLFLRFMTGATTATGKPTLLNAPEPTLDSAFSTLLGKSGIKRTDAYTSWTTWGQVKKSAKLYFSAGDPFASVLAPGGAAARWYKLALVVRNRIAHPSDSAKAKFINAARKYKAVPTLRKGYMTGEFLLEAATSPHFDPKHGGATVFQATARSMVELADRLMA